MPDIKEIQKKNQRTIILLVAAFLVPVIAAKIALKNRDSSGKTKNHGELITPARPLAGFQLTSSIGQPVNIKDLQGSWQVIYIGSGKCTEQCQDRLSTMHQARMGQGSAMSRVRLVYISLDEIKNEEVQKLKKAYLQLTVLTGSPEQVKTITKLFKTDATSNIRDGKLIYIVDPLGNLMMRYKSDVRLIGIIKDLEHLLKASRIG